MAEAMCGGLCWEMMLGKVVIGQIKTDASPDCYVSKGWIPRLKWELDS